MNGTAQAIAHGAATIINAIALGKGAAFGVRLSTKAKVTLTDEPQVITGKINSDPTENTLLIEKTVTHVFQRFKVEKRFGAKVQTWSEIPIARGLKSSSAAANAVALATVAALGEKLDDLEIVKLGVAAAFDAKVTVTGAFDDACASYFGGAVITNNTKKRIVKRSTLPEDLTVLFHVPAQKAYTADSNVNRLKLVKPLLQIAYKEATKGKFWDALSLNGLIYSATLGYDTSAALDALAAGAVAAGLCGKGPAVTAVVADDKVETVKQALQSHKGAVLQTYVNHEKAKVTA
jgi:shikimate kinase